MLWSVIICIYVCWYMSHSCIRPTSLEASRCCSISNNLITNNLIRRLKPFQKTQHLFVGEQFERHVEAAAMTTWSIVDVWSYIANCKVMRPPITDNHKILPPTFKHDSQRFIYASSNSEFLQIRGKRTPFHFGAVQIDPESHMLSSARVRHSRRIGACEREQQFRKTDRVVIEFWRLHVELVDDGVLRRFQRCARQYSAAVIRSDDVRF